MRSWLVRNDTLGRLAMLYGFLGHLHISSTNLDSRIVLTLHTMAANVLAAYIWAVYKEHGFEACKQCLDALFGPLTEPLYFDLGRRRQFEQETKARMTRNEQP